MSADLLLSMQAVFGTVRHWFTTEGTSAGGRYRVAVATSEKLVGGPYDGQDITDLACDQSPDGRVVRVLGPPEPAIFERASPRRPQPRQALRFTRHEYVREADGSLTFRRSFPG
jgi:hypothetical protein